MLRRIGTGRLSGAAAIVAFAALSGCSSGPEMPPEMALEPEPYRIAVAPIVLDVPPGAKDEASLYLAERQDWSDYFVKTLQKMNVASEVTLVPAEIARKDTQADVRFAKDGGYDLLLRPRLVRASFNYENLSNSAFLSGTLWLLTWIGGFFPDDAEYRSDMSIECDAWNPFGQLPLDKATGRADAKTSLSYFDRNDFFSLGTLESLVVPPFWTHDGVAETSESLTDQCTLQIAADLKRQLRELPSAMKDKGKVGFPIFVFSGPANGSTIAGNATDLTARIISPGHGIERVDVYVNKRLHAQLQHGQELKELGKQIRADNVIRECDFVLRDVPLPNPDVNEIRVVATLEGDFATVARTLKLYGPAGAPVPDTTQ